MMVIHDVKFDNKYDQTPQNSSQELSMSYKHDCVLDALIIMLGSGKNEYNSGITYYVDSLCQM